MVENFIYKQIARDGNKYPVLTQLRIERQLKRWELEEDIKKLEVKFKGTSQELNPPGWILLQDQLGVAYRALMNFNQPVGSAIESRITNYYFMHKE